MVFYVIYVKKNVMRGNRPGPKTNIMLALGHYDHRVHRGVVRYAKEQGWRLAVRRTPGLSVPWGWQGDGIIAGSGSTPEFADYLQSTTLPVVDLSWRHPEVQVPRLLSDNATIGIQAAEHLMARGFTNFLCMARRPDWISDERFPAFSKRLRAEGRSCEQIFIQCPPETAWPEYLEQVQSLLLAQPRPIGVLCIDDQLASDVIDACFTAGIVVPDELAVLGIGNDDLICDTAAIELSSVDNNQEGQGYAGAALLHRLLHGESLPLEPFRVSSKGVVTRTSTDIIAVGNRKVAQAVRYLQQNFMQPIGVQDVARAVDLTRQGLTKSSTAHLGRTPGDELRRIRIEAAKQALVSTEDNLDNIARQVGYSSANTLCLAFKRELGITPNTFRKGKA